jgi:transposase
MALFAPSAVERAMRVHEVILRAMSGEINWIQAADILGMDARSLRRWKARLKSHGYDGLLDRRHGRPSPRRAPFAEVQRILRLYRETYQGFNVRHFHQIFRRDHGVTLSYSFVKKALQEAGLVAKRKARGRHLMRREPRACFGELLHIDGSNHPWLALAPEERSTLVAIQDDATRQLLFARLFPVESTEAVMQGLREVVETHGIPMALYSDRASWAFHTPKAGGKVDKSRPTQVGRALKQLGVEHIPAYTPQARGRQERLNRTLQDRLVNELRVAGIATCEEANRYLRERFIPAHNATFGRKPRDPASVFVPAAGADLDAIFSIEEKRVVGKDNTVSMGGVRLQLAKQPGRATCAGMEVIVRRHLDGRHTVWQGQRHLGTFDAEGQATPLKSRSKRPTGAEGKRSRCATG